MRLLMKFLIGLLVTALFSPSVVLVGTRCQASEQVSLPKAQNHKSNHQNSVSFWLCAIELSLKIHYCWKCIHLNHIT